MVRDFHGSIIQVIKAMQVVERGYEVDYTNDDLNSFREMFGTINPACLPALLTFFEEQKMSEICGVIQDVIGLGTARGNTSTLAA
ncbi:hypothetical protein [Telluribacter sp. SYSU D00476]|uniref:hypothetical protein n=1 Tax=Telluribacter sp. SYSU D00476 TaxID=2811430 RepID=UPI001FF29F2E|nr:hypothetical protein [Telluribacter sp. SYSU D00476]